MLFCSLSQDAECRDRDINACCRFPNGWLPDVDDIRNKCRYNDSIAGILLLSPDNPTGAVYPRSLLEEIAEIARQHHLFLIADEIYAHIMEAGCTRSRCANPQGRQTPKVWLVTGMKS